MRCRGSMSSTGKTPRERPTSSRRSGCSPAPRASAAPRTRRCSVLGRRNAVSTLFLLPPCGSRPPRSSCLRPASRCWRKSRSRSTSTASRWKARRSLPGSFTRWSFRRRTCRWCGRGRPSDANSWTPPSASSCQSTAITCASISASCCSATPCSRTLPSFRSCRTRWMSGRKTWPKRPLRSLFAGRGMWSASARRPRRSMRGSPPGEKEWI